MHEVAPDWTDEPRKLAERVAYLEQALGAELIRLTERELTPLGHSFGGPMETAQADVWSGASDVATTDFKLGAAPAEPPD